MVCVEAAKGSDFDGDNGFDDALRKDFLPGFVGGTVGFGEGGVINDLEIARGGFDGSEGGGGSRKDVHGPRKAGGGRQKE